MNFKDDLFDGLDNVEIDGNIPLETSPRTSLEFEFDSTAPSDDIRLDVITDTSSTESYAEPVIEEKAAPAAEQIKKADALKNEEFIIPESYDAGTSDLVDTPANIRPTYLPRFTDVSETYRMQDDPRPRPEMLTQTKVVSEVGSTCDSDPISESVEDKEVDKVVVTTGTVSAPVMTDESITILKFSTLIESETQDASAIPLAEQHPHQPEQEFDPEPEVEEPEYIGEEEKHERNMTIPDPETNYHVVEFSPNMKPGPEEEPEGSVDPSEISKRYKGTEFTSPVQRDAVKDRFLDTLMSIRVRLVSISVLLAALGIVELCAFFGYDALSFAGLGNIKAAKAFVDLVFSIGFFVLAVPEALGALKSVVRGKCVPELFIVASLLVVATGDIIMIFTAPPSYFTFGVLYGLQALITVIAAYTKQRADFDAFKVISRNSSKNVLDQKLTRDLPRENHALDGVVDEYNSRIVRMFRTVFVSDFYARSSMCFENYGNILMMISVSTGISLVTGLVSLFISGFSLTAAVQSFTMVFLLSLPVFSILAHKLPYRHSCNEARAEEGAFVGEASLYECSGSDVFTYDDIEIFGTEDVAIRKVHLYGKVYNTPKAMKQMYSLFSVVGGPLDYVFASSLDRKCPSASDIVIEDDGISGSVEGHRIYAGTEAYMIRHGIKIPDDDYRTNSSTTDSTKIMYGAEDDNVYVKFFIRYSFSEEFTMLLPDLRSKKIVPLIYTSDPNINGDLLKVLTFGDDVIRVMKKYEPASLDNQVYRHISSGVVTHGDKMNLVNLVLLAKKYMTLQSSIATIELIAMIVGAVIAVLFSINGAFNIPATFLALWQVMWCLILYIKSRRAFGHKKTKEDETEYEEY